MIRVFLLDDHEVVRRGLTELVEAEPDMTVVGQAGGVTDLLTAVERTRPDVAVLDVRLADGNGIEACREIRSEHPDIRCLMLTSFADDRALVDAAIAGAAGFVLKQIRGNDLIASIRAVAEGRQLLDTAEARMALRRVREADGGMEQLTPQEQRVFELIGAGMTNRQIGTELHLAEKTVKNYVSNLLAKLGMARRSEAAAFAARVDERRRMREPGPL
jgi:two-component system, NarL family, response regulator DevR